MAKVLYSLIENPCIRRTNRRKLPLALWPELPTRPIPYISPCRPTHSIALIHIYYTQYTVPYTELTIKSRESSCRRMCTCIVQTRRSLGGEVEDIFNQAHPDPMPNPIVGKPSCTYIGPRAFVCQAQLSWSLYRSNGIGSPN